MSRYAAAGYKVPRGLAYASPTTVASAFQHLFETAREYAGATSTVIDLRRCRDLLGPDCSLTDDQIKLLRDELTTLANIALDLGVQESRNGAKSAIEMAATVVPEDQYEGIRERASILELEGGLPRNEAERRAMNGWSMREGNPKSVN